MLAVISTLYFHEDSARLLLTFNAAVTHMDIRTEVKDRVISHDRPVVAALYSASINQVRMSSKRLEDFDVSYHLQLHCTVVEIVKESEKI